MATGSNVDVVSRLIHLFVHASPFEFGAPVTFPTG